MGDESDGQHKVDNAVTTTRENDQDQDVGKEQEAKTSSEAMSSEKALLKNFRLVLAFSRMTKKKVYVQDKLWEAQTIVKELMQGPNHCNTVVMVCGSTKMGNSVKD